MRASHYGARHEALVDHVHPFQNQLFERPLFISHFFGIGRPRSLVDGRWTTSEAGLRLVASTWRICPQRA
jgi:hypothetical protein